MKLITTLLMLIISLLLWAMDNDFVMYEICSDYVEGKEIFSIDFDDDGDFDLLTAGTDCRLWTNDGVGNFTPSDILTGTFGARSIRAADLDEDGDKDVVIAIPGTNQILIMENNGNGFDPIILDNSMVMPHTVDVKDLDGDGDYDILCSEFDTSNAFSEVAWWQNNGNLNFSDKITITEVFQQSTFVFADFIDSDDYMDVVACGEILSDVLWWQNDGFQNFGSGIVVDDNFFRAHTVVGSDLDQDGDIDILGAACMSGLLAWWENDGEGGFTRNDVDNFGGALWMDCADFDNDGDNDLFAVGQGSSQAHIYENLGDEVFTDNPLDGVFGDGFSATARDFDNDGDIDLAAIGRTSGQICWWKNKLLGADFEVDVTTGNVPLTVAFSDSSILPNPIVNWSWDFNNDGIIDSNEQNPDWIYGEPGIYSVRLEVSDGTNTNSVLEEDIIQVFNGHTALEFTDSESCINCPAENSMNLIDAFTIEAWVYLYSYGPDASWGSGRIFDKSAVSIFLNNQFPLYPDQSLVVKMHHSDGTLSTSTTPATSLQLNQWQHVAVSYDGIDQVRIFVDGLQMMFNQPTAPSGDLEDNSQENIFIGNLAAMNKAFDGIIDEVRIWNFFMDQTQIQQNMNSYLHGWESGLMHYWQINEGNGDTIFDLAGSNNAEIHDLNWCAGIELDPVEISSYMIPEFDFNLKNYPNPFNPATTISFNLATETNVSVEIYNVKGQKVKTLVNERMPEGQHEIIWDGLNQDNNSVSSGVYLYEVKIENQKFLNRMILIK